MTIKKARLHRDPEFVDRHQLERKVVKSAGWHFTTIGGVNKIISRIEAYSHKEFNNDEFKDPEKLEEIINKGGDIFGSDWYMKFEEVDDSYPQYLGENQSKYQHLIKKI